MSLGAVVLDVLICISAKPIVQVLKVTIGVPEDEQVSLIGPAFKGKNKWQNGFLGRDNAVYGLPCNAETVLRISEDDVSSRIIWCICHCHRTSVYHAAWTLLRVAGGDNYWRPVARCREVGGWCYGT